MRTLTIVIALGLMCSQAVAGSAKDSDCDKVAFQMGMVYSTASAERTHTVKKTPSTNSARVVASH